MQANVSERPQMLKHCLSSFFSSFRNKKEILFEFNLRGKEMYKLEQEPEIQVENFDKASPFKKCPCLYWNAGCIIKRSFLVGENSERKENCKSKMEKQYFSVLFDGKSFVWLALFETNLLKINSREKILLYSIRKKSNVTKKRKFLLHFKKMLNISWSTTKIIWIPMTIIFFTKKKNFFSL